MLKQNGDSTPKVNTVDENNCVVCFKIVDIYSVGECDHPVCYECSTRMRVLCEQNECPICRQFLSKVIFTQLKLPYRELETKNYSEYYSRKYRIGFYTREIQQKFFELLNHPCPKCDLPPFRTFQALRTHVRREHDLFYCDLCVEHLKIFTFERCCYTQNALNQHYFKGDKDNTSHRGHPLCEYCNKRYLDRDELFRHLRRDHYFCHFCDADGCNQFYPDYAALAEHFQQEHYLCKEGKCATEEFTGVFRTEIDYKVHVANVHGKSMNKQQAKQTRTLQLEITLGPRGRARQLEQNIASVRSSDSDIEVTHIKDSNLTLHHIDPCSEQEFPALAAKSNAPNISLVRPPPPPMFGRNRLSGLARTKENFPDLSTTPTLLENNQIQQHSQGPPMSSVLRKPSNITNNIEGMPRSMASISTLNASTSSNQSSTTTASNSSNSGDNGMVIHVSNRVNGSTNTIQGLSANTKPFLMNFPPLSTSKVKKQNSKSDCNEKTTNPIETPVLATSAISEKYRPLVDDYVSVARTTTFQKIQIVKKEEFNEKSRKETEMKDVPKLTNQDFPTLSGKLPKSGAHQVTPTWIKYSNVSDKKQKELENRKSKIAPIPIMTKLTATTKTMSATRNINNPCVSENNAKKDNYNHNNVNSKINNKTKEKKAKEGGSNNSSNNILENKSIRTNSQSSKTNVHENQLKPPPGFSAHDKDHTSPGSESTSQLNVVTLNSVAKSPNNLTFTSSMGESFNIIPAHNYISPIDALQRNQKLISYFKESLETPEAFEDFRNISQQFHEGIYKTQAYYEYCQAALKESFNKIFPELVFLLPDISKQQALYLVHQQYLNNLSPGQQKMLSKLQVCSTCKQVLSQYDLDNHHEMHKIMDNFPPLNGNYQHQKHQNCTMNINESTTGSKT